MAKFGCGCVQCVAGFLTPRIIKKLHDGATMRYDLLSDLGSVVDEENWCLALKETLVYVPDNLQPHF